MISGVFDFLSNVIFQTCYVGSDGNFPKPLDKQTESELLDKIAEGDIDARDKLIKHNMRLVIHVVKKYNNYYDTDELIRWLSGTYKSGKNLFKRQRNRSRNLCRKVYWKRDTDDFEGV